MKKTNTRSPLRNPPLRNPAQSLTEYKDDLISDKLLTYIMFPVFALWWAFNEWCGHLFNWPSHHIAATFLAVGSLLFCIPKIFRLRKKVSAINKGIRGEIAVGQFLEQFRAQGYQVFHDIPGDAAKGEKFNIDHVLIGPNGVFTIETKYHQKPERGQCVIEKDGDNLSINGRQPARNPIVQAKAQSRHLAKVLSESTGQVFTVQPIVIYPGWYVKNITPDASVHVLNEGMVASVLVM